jgi:hypothetical protein
MTRAEKLARQERNAQAHLDRMRQTLAQVTARRKKAEQQARERRYLLVGAMVEQAGLFTLSDSTLAGLFTLLARLAAVPDPVPVLEAPLHDVPCPSGATTEARSPEDGDAGGATTAARHSACGATCEARGTAAPTYGGVTALP